MMSFWSGEGAGAGRVRRALLPSVLFLFCAAAACPAAGALAAAGQGRTGVQALQLVLPLLLAACAAAVMTACGSASAMAGAEAEGNLNRKREIRMTGFVLLLLIEGAVCLAAAFFSSKSIFPLPVSAALGEAVRMRIRGLVLCPAAMGVFLYAVILLFFEGGEAEAAAVSAAACVLQVIFSKGVFRMQGGAGFGYSLTAAYFLCALCAAFLLLKRSGRRGRRGISAVAAGQILGEGVPYAEAGISLTLLVIILNTRLVLTGREDYLTAAFYIFMAFISPLLLGRGLALGFDPMLRVYRAEGNEKGILFLMKDGFPAVLLAGNIWMAVLFLAAGTAAGVWIPEAGEIRAAAITAVRLFAPFSVFYCMCVFLSGYYRAVGEKGVSRFLRLTTFFVLPLVWAAAGIRLAGFNGMWTGLGAAGFFSLLCAYAAVKVRGRRKKGNVSGWLLLDREVIDRQFYEVCPASEEGFSAMLTRAEAYLAAGKVPEYEQLRILQLLKELCAGICRRAAEEDPFYADCTISETGKGIFQVILRDDGPLTDKADPRHTICSFRMYGLSRSIPVGADALLAPASAENRTVFRV